MEINIINNKNKCPYITGRLECLVGAFGNVECLNENHKKCEHKIKHDNFAIKRKEFVKNNLN